MGSIQDGLSVLTRCISALTQRHGADDDMSPETAGDLIEERCEEVRALVSPSTRDRAFDRLLDLAKDFARESRDEAILLNDRYSRWEDQVRKHGATRETESTLSELIESLLNLVTRIEHSAQSRAGATATRVGRPARAIPSSSFHDDFKSFRASRREAPRPVDRAPEPFVFRGENLVKRFPTRGFTLEVGSIDLASRTVTGIVGANGSGKSTLLKIIAGQLAADSGILHYPLLHPGGLDWMAIGRQSAYIAQEPKGWHGRLSDTLHLTAAAHGRFGVDNQTDIDFILSRLGLTDARDAYWHELSGGMKMRFELARVLVWEPKLLVLDEPLAQLDVLARKKFLTDLRDIATRTEREVAVVISSQHIDETEAASDRMLFLQSGRTRFYGTAEELARKQTESLFEVACSVPAGDVLTLTAPLGVRSVEPAGLHLLVRAPRGLTGADLLRVLAGAGVTSFREITGSTESLFLTEPTDDEHLAPPAGT